MNGFVDEKLRAMISVPVAATKERDRFELAVWLLGEHLPKRQWFMNFRHWVLRSGGNRVAAYGLLINFKTQMVKDGIKRIVR